MSRSRLLYRSLSLSRRLGSSLRLGRSREGSLRRSEGSRRARSLLPERPRRLSRLLSRLEDLRSRLLHAVPATSAQDVQQDVERICTFR